MATETSGTALDDAVGQLVRALEASDGPHPRQLAAVTQTLLDELGQDVVNREAARAALLAASFVGVVAPGAARRLAADPAAIDAVWERSPARQPSRSMRRAAGQLGVTALGLVCALTDGELDVTAARQHLADRAAEQGWDTWTFLHGTVALRAVVIGVAGERACTVA